jgi:hypothetical protein
MIKAFFKNLHAAFETLIFLRSGVERFNPSEKSAWLSMLIMVSMTPVMFFSVSISPPLGTEDIDSNYLAMIMIFKNYTAFAIYAAIMYSFARLTDQLKGFPLMITASNWGGLLFAIISAPVLYLFWIEAITRQTLEDVFIWVMVYQYAVSAFVIWRCYPKLPWELAAAIAIGSMFIGETVHDTVFALFDIPIVDYFDVY